jgi:hypothetical protein
MGLFNKTKDYVEVYKRKDADYDWRRVDGGNHKKVATSGGQGFTEANDAAEAALRLFPRMEVRYIGIKGHE